MLIKRRLQHICVPVNIEKFLRTAFFNKTTFMAASDMPSIKLKGIEINSDIANQELTTGTSSRKGLLVQVLLPIFFYASDFAHVLIS